MVAPTLKRFTLAEYHQLVELGVLSEDDRVKLIHGQIIEMAAKGTAHKVCLTRLRSQSPLTLLRNSEPEPDFTIVQNRADDYLNSHPGAVDTLLVIEVSDSFLSYDKEVKLPLYAEAGISNYWLFSLVENYLEIYSQPYQDLQGKFGYSMKRIVLPDQAINLPCLPNLLLNLLSRHLQEGVAYKPLTLRWIPCSTL